MGPGGSDVGTRGSEVGLGWSEVGPGGGMDGQMDVHMEILPCVMQDIVPFGSTAQKGFAEVVALALALKVVAVEEVVAVIEATAVALAVAIAGMAAAKWQERK